MTKSGMALFVFLFFLIFGLPSPAFAYLDPGTGSMILQLLLGGLAGLLVVGKLYWQRLKGLFARKGDPMPSEIQEK